MLNVTFFGVRGSTPCCGDDTIRYGGNTACVAVESPGEDPIVFDMGTGLRYFGATQPQDGSFRGTALVTHLHWDHIQGLPFFVPVLRPGARLTVHAPTQPDGLTVEAAFAEFMRDPYFPVRVTDLPGSIEFSSCDDTTFEVGRATVVSRSIPHTGRTNGYRVERDGRSVAYLSDHQQPVDGSVAITDGALELCQGVDVLIHDAQYTPEEWNLKRTWGHCTVEYACWVAKEAGAKRLVLFHHDPSHDDDHLDRLGRCAAEWGERAGVEVITAAEGLTISLA